MEGSKAPSNIMQVFDFRFCVGRMTCATTAAFNPTEKLKEWKKWFLPRKGDVVLDVGSNIGATMAYFAACRIKRALYVEPSHGVTWEKLKENADRFQQAGYEFKLAQAAPSVDEPGDDGWGDFGLDDVQRSSPQPKVQAAPIVDEPGDKACDATNCSSGDFGDFGDVQSPQVKADKADKAEKAKADAEPQGDEWGMLDLDGTVNAPRDPSLDVLEMQHAEQLSAASARELEQQEQQLKNAGEQPNEHSAKVQRLQFETVRLFLAMFFLLSPFGLSSTFSWLSFTSFTRCLGSCVQCFSTTSKKGSKACPLQRLTPSQSERG